MMDLKLSAKTAQNQLMSLNQLKSLEILAMDREQLGEFLKNEYLENPLLDCAGTYQPGKQTGEEYGFTHTLTYQTSWKEVVDQENQKDIPDTKSRELKEYILDQLPSGNCEPEKEKLYRYLVDCLDDSGYFTLSEEEAAEGAGVTASEIREALRVLRDLEPYGVFAPDLRSCLLKQIEHQDMEGSLLWKITDRYLLEVAEGNIGKISRELMVSTSDIRRAIEALVKLSPRPVNGFGAVGADYIIPDIIFGKDDGEWEIRLNDRWTEDYRINDYYAAMMNETEDRELKEYFRKKLERARQVLANIRQRRKTVLEVSWQLLESQRGFFEGSAPLRALSMKTVADSLGISVSTVSRAVKGKYIEYPGGTIAAKNLFAAASSRKNADNGEESLVSADSVKESIARFIKEEDKTKPLSDQKLSELLNQKGMTVSRRTVAKYREALGIGSSSERKHR